MRKKVLFLIEVFIFSRITMSDISDPPSIDIYSRYRCVRQIAYKLPLRELGVRGMGEVECHICETCFYQTPRFRHCIVYNYHCTLYVDRIDHLLLESCYLCEDNLVCINNIRSCDYCCGGLNNLVGRYIDEGYGILE